MSSNILWRQALRRLRRWSSCPTAPWPRTTSGWTASTHFQLSHRNPSANTRRARGSSTPPTRTRSSTPPTRTAPKPVSFQATSAACCSRTCPKASPTSPATSGWATQLQPPKPQWWRKVSCPPVTVIVLCSCALPVILLAKKQGKPSFF